ncbi:hypothetical protein JXR93_14465 [bacterium]|nr:hypothetical protein [bacterium]
MSTKFLFIFIIFIVLGSCSNDSVSKDYLEQRLIKIRCGDGHKISLFSDGKLYFEGEYSSFEKTIQKDLTDIFTYQIIDFATNSNNSCFINTIGELYCMGQNSFGELAQNSSEGVNKPIKIELPQKVIDVTVGLNHICAILVDKTVFCWGNNSLGEIGNGKSLKDYSSPQKAFESSPQQVLNIKNAVKISSGKNHTCALLENGFLSCWGSNRFNCISESETEIIATPILLVEYPNISDIDLGGDTTCMLKNGISLKCIGKYFNPLTPININLSILEMVKQFSISDGYGCATLNSDELYCWGDNQNAAFDALPIFYYEIVKIEYPNIILEMSAAPDNLCIREKK